MCFCTPRALALELAQITSLYWYSATGGASGISSHRLGSSRAWTARKKRSASMWMTAMSPAAITRDAGTRHASPTWVARLGRPHHSDGTRRAVSASRRKRAAVSFVDEAGHGALRRLTWR
eukprot:scaffold71244_cov65-Phaeocystis_antarctica.AAC.10